ncbi:CCHC-type domain-containing protein [Trichonephila clavipes]|nr:CCHC-type domain-containing protein [Trichonephila clavipes]
MPSPAFRREPYKVSHLMKGVAEDIYQALLTREINDSSKFYQMVQLYRRYEAEEKEIVQDEVERVLAPVSAKPTETRPRPTYAAVTRKYRAPVQKFPPEPRKTDVWRTADNDLFVSTADVWTCNALLPRERLSLTTLETADGTSTTLALKKYADQTLLAVLRQVPREADPNTSLQIPVAISPIHHDVILGWDFLEASQAVIDCGQNELVLEDICRDSTAPDAWNLYATRDYTLSRIL